MSDILHLGMKLIVVIVSNNIIIRHINTNFYPDVIEHIVALNALHGVPSIGILSELLYIAGSKNDF